MSEKFCGFPACQGGCHWCYQVKKQRAEAPLYEAAIRVLHRDSIDDDVRLLAEQVEQDCRPRIDEVNQVWLEDVPPTFLDRKRPGQQVDQV